MQIRSSRIQWREGARRRRCHGRLRRQQGEESRAGVRKLGCDVVNFVMNVTSDDESERRREEDDEVEDGCEGEVRCLGG